VEQGGSGARLRPGDLTLIDSRQGYALRFPQTVDVLSLQLPIGWLQTWVPSPHPLLAKHVDGSRGWGQVLSTFVQQLQPGLNPTARCAEQVLSDQLGQLLSLALDEEAPARAIDTPSTALLQRLDDWLQAEGHHPGVHAAQAALALGVSVRSLYRGLSAHHTTFADRLLQHRLAAAQRMLGSPAFDGLTLAEIGRRVGWPDPSHFTRVCRRALGHTPQQLRWQHRPADSTPPPGKA
jgi:AraC-like DNA-binding protein